MATVHLIHGYLCCGKTTFAKELERRTGGIRFSLDEWMTALSGDPVEWDDELYERLYTLLMGFWPAITACGLDVILDFGFWRRSRRDEARAAVSATGSMARLYLGEAPVGALCGAEPGVLALTEFARQDGVRERVGPPSLLRHWPY